MYFEHNIMETKNFTHVMHATHIQEIFLFTIIGWTQIGWDTKIVQYKKKMHEKHQAIYILWLCKQYTKQRNVYKIIIIAEVWCNIFIKAIYIFYLSFT